jgi:hypothetical protein
MKKFSSYLKETQRVSMTTINWLLLFKETVAVYTDNHMKTTNTLCWQNAELMFKQVEHIPLCFKGLMQIRSLAF